MSKIQSGNVSHDTACASAAATQQAALAVATTQAQAKTADITYFPGVFGLSDCERGAALDFFGRAQGDYSAPGGDIIGDGYMGFGFPLGSSSVGADAATVANSKISLLSRSVGPGGREAHSRCGLPLVWRKWKQREGLRRRQPRPRTRSG